MMPQVMPPPDIPPVHHFLPPHPGNLTGQVTVNSAGPQQMGGPMGGPMGQPNNHLPPNMNPIRHDAGQIPPGQFGGPLPMRSEPNNAPFAPNSPRTSSSNGSPPLGVGGFANQSPVSGHYRQSQFSKFKATYDSYSFRKARQNELPHGVSPSWRWVKRTRTSQPQKVLREMIKKQDRKSGSNVSLKLEKLNEKLQEHVHRLLLELSNNEQFNSVDWNIDLVDFDARKGSVRGQKGSCDLSTLTLVLRRQPKMERPDINIDALPPPLPLVDEVIDIHEPFPRAHYQSTWNEQTNYTHGMPANIPRGPPMPQGPNGPHPNNHPGGPHPGGPHPGGPHPAVNGMPGGPHMSGKGGPAPGPNMNQPPRPNNGPNIPHGHPQPRPPSRGPPGQPGKVQGQPGGAGPPLQGRPPQVNGKVPNGPPRGPMGPPNYDDFSESDDYPSDDPLVVPPIKVKTNQQGGNKNMGHPPPPPPAPGNQPRARSVPRPSQTAVPVQNVDVRGRSKSRGGLSAHDNMRQSSRRRLSPEPTPYHMGPGRHASHKHADRVHPRHVRHSRHGSGVKASMHDLPRKQMDPQEKFRHWSSHAHYDYDSDDSVSDSSYSASTGSYTTSYFDSDESESMNQHILHGRKVTHMHRHGRKGHRKQRSDLTDETGYTIPSRSSHSKKSRGRRSSHSGRDRRPQEIVVLPVQTVQNMRPTKLKSNTSPPSSPDMNVPPQVPMVHHYSRSQYPRAPVYHARGPGGVVDDYPLFAAGVIPGVTKQPFNHVAGAYRHGSKKPQHRRSSFSSIGSSQLTEAEDGWMDVKYQQAQQRKARGGLAHGHHLGHGHGCGNTGMGCSHSHGHGHGVCCAAC